MKYIKLYFLIMLGLAGITAVYFPFNETEASNPDQEMEISTSPSSNFISMSNMAPGDVVAETLSVQNKGNVNFSYIVNALKESGDQALYDILELNVIRNGTSFYTGRLADLKTAQLGELDGLLSEDLQFSISLPLEADNAVKKKSTSVLFEFIANAQEQGEVGSSLPDTATSIFNYIFIGSVLLLLGLVLYHIHRIKRLKENH